MPDPTDLLFQLAIHFAEDRRHTSRAALLQLGDVGGERSVGQVDVGVAAEMHGDGEFNVGYHGCVDSSGGFDVVVAGHEDGGLAPFVGEQVVGVDAASWPAG